MALTTRCVDKTLYTDDKSELTYDYLCESELICFVFVRMITRFVVVVVVALNQKQKSHSLLAINRPLFYTDTRDDKCGTLPVYLLLH